jgi:hypothetical protein
VKLSKDIAGASPVNAAESSTYKYFTVDDMVIEQHSINLDKQQIVAISVPRNS